MEGLHPLARSFALLCIGSAFGLAWLEWHDPLGLKAADASPIKVVSNLSNRISVANGRRPRNVVKTDLEIVVQLSSRTISVYRRDEVIKQYSVAIGQAEWQTPEGLFSVMHKQEYPAWQHPITGEVVPAGQSNPLGSRWIGFWSGSGGEIGFHGTNQESLIGEAVSHGCVRMFNEDIEDLYNYVAVGTPVRVKR